MNPPQPQSPQWLQEAPWAQTHRDLLPVAIAIQSQTITELANLSLQTALKEQPKPYQSALEP